MFCCVSLNKSNLSNVCLGWKICIDMCRIRYTSISIMDNDWSLWNEVSWFVLCSLLINVQDFYFIRPLTGAWPVLCAHLCSFKKQKNIMYFPVLYVRFNPYLCPICKLYILRFADMVSKTMDTQNLVRWTKT